MYVYMQIQTFICICYHFGRRQLFGPTVSPSVSAAERTWHMQDSQGQIVAFAFRQKCSKPFKLFPLRSEVVIVEVGSG